jgi:general secretion pathway protein G
MTDMNTRMRRRPDRRLQRILRAPHSRIPAQHGVTLIEIMVVVVILGILAALVAPNVMRRIDDAQITKVKQDMRAFETALSLYKMDNYKYPSTDQGLQALISQPNDPTVRNWKQGGYLGSGGLTKDPWQNDYKYAYPGQHGEYDIYTLGADGQEGGEGVNADRGNWQTE